MPQRPRDLHKERAVCLALAGFSRKSDARSCKCNTVSGGPTLASLCLKHPTKGLSDDVEWVAAVAAAERFNGLQPDGVEFRAQWPRPAIARRCGANNARDVSWIDRFGIGVQSSGAITGGNGSRRRHSALMAGGAVRLTYRCARGHHPVAGFYLQFAELAPLRP